MSRTWNLAMLAGALVALPSLERAKESQNVHDLARHVGCSDQTARELYRLARRYGYGGAAAAYRRMFR